MSFTRVAVPFAVALATLAASPAAYAVDPTFTDGSGSPFAVGETPAAVATGDFNGDGKVDAATADSAGDQVSVLLATSGVGGFAAPVAVPVGDGPLDLLAADFNRDGRDDLATLLTGASPGIVILLGRTNGVPAVSGTPIATSAEARRIATGDFNRDSRADLVVNGVPGTNDVQPLFGNGSGAFAPGSAAASGCTSGAFAVDTGDATGDGKTDLLVGCVAEPAADSVKVLAGDGTGDFAAPVNAPPNAPGNTEGIGVVVDLAVADMNADGLPDVVGVGDARRIGVSLGQPGGGFAGSAGSPAPGSPFHLDANQQPLRLGVADMNGDGRLDATMLSSLDSKILVAVGDGSGGFAVTDPLPTPDEVGIGYAAPAGVTALAVDDLNDDAKPDIAVVSAGAGAGSDFLSVRLNSTPFPGVRTLGASGVTATTATVAGSVNPSGAATTYLFEYGRTTTYGSTAASAGPLSGTADQPVATTLRGLAPSTTYHYRIIGTNGNGTGRGGDRVFSTGPAPAGGGGPTVVPDRLAPTLAVSRVKSKLKRSTLFKRGVRARATADEPARLLFELLGSARRVRLARAGDVILRDRALPLATGARSVTLKVPRGLRRGLGNRFKLRLRVTATDAAGNRTVVTKRIAVRAG